ncbi:unnamed protein product, partial [Strongylus vulgaris]
RTRSDATISSLNDSVGSAKKGTRFYADRNSPRTIKEAVYPVQTTKQPPVLTTTSPSSHSQTLNVCNPKTGRIHLEVPFVPAKALLEFAAPIGTPVLEYPAECHNCKVAGPFALTLEVTTEPLNFLLTKKVQGVVKYTACNGYRPRNVKMYCYLESAVKVRRWTHSLVHTFADSDKIKFDIVLAKGNFMFFDIRF